MSIVSDDSQFRSQDRYKAGRVFTQDRGRPSYSISKEQLELFIEFGFHTSEIATITQSVEDAVELAASDEIPDPEAREALQEVCSLS